MKYVRLKIVTDVGWQAVATRFLGDIEMDDNIRLGCIEMCQEFHTTTLKLSDRFRAELDRYNYVTPTSYLEMINTFKLLLDNKRSQVIKVFSCHLYVYNFTSLILNGSLMIKIITVSSFLKNFYTELW